MATMRLKVNGTLSSSKRTKHIKARYFFIKDKVVLGEVDIEHCPTEIMGADVLNKPKGGQHFCLDRSYLMNVDVDYNNDLELLKTHPPSFLRRIKVWLTHNANVRQLTTGACWVITQSQNSITRFPNGKLPIGKTFLPIN